MVIDRISAKGLDTLLNLTFGEKGKHYEIISKQGLNYPKLGDIEIKLDDLTKKAYSPFSTIVTRKALANQVDEYKSDSISSTMNDIKKQGVFSIFSGFLKKKEELVVISEASEKCISDELVKSQRMLESKEFENPAIILLAKGIRNLETPEKIKGLTEKNIQEIGAIQIGMAINEMKINVPHLFTFNSYDEKSFKRSLQDVSRSSFVASCCANAANQAKKIMELTLISKKDNQYDAFLTDNQEIDYSNSFKDFDVADKNKHIEEIKQTVRKRSGNYFSK